MYFIHFSWYKTWKVHPIKNNLIFWQKNRQQSCLHGSTPLYFFCFLDVSPLAVEAFQSRYSYKPELKLCTQTHTPFNRGSVMALGKNLPQSAQSDSFYYLLITLLLQAGEFSNLLRRTGRRVEEEVVFPALRDKRPSQVSENVQRFCILNRLYFLLFHLYIKWRNGGVSYDITYCVLYMYV